MSEENVVEKFVQLVFEVNRLKAHLDDTRSQLWKMQSRMS